MYIYSSISMWTSGLFPLFGCHEYFYCEHLCRSFCMDKHFHFLGVYLGVELLGDTVTLFNLFRNSQIVFHSCGFISHSHQQCIGF